jgi:ABC-type branched-subunit amino acid transport system permease subunit
MNNLPPNKTRRLVFMISGATDALIGAILLLMGFGLLPLEVTDYGFENWHAMLLGGALFIIGIWVVAYNLSRLEE